MLLLDFTTKIIDNINLGVLMIFIIVNPLQTCNVVRQMLLKGNIFENELSVSVAKF